MSDYIDRFRRQRMKRVEFALTFLCLFTVGAVFGWCLHVWVSK